MAFWQGVWFGWLTVALYAYAFHRIIHHDADSKRRWAQIVKAWRGEDDN